MTRVAVQRNSGPQGKAWGHQATVRGGRKHVWGVFWCLMSFQDEAQTPGQPLAGSPGGEMPHAACTAPGTIVGAPVTKRQGAGATSAAEMGLGRVGFAPVAEREAEGTA